MQATPLHPDQRDDLLRLLEPEPETNLFLIDVARSRTLAQTDDETWFGLGSPLQAVALVVGREGPDRRARLVVPFGDADACVRIGERIQRDGPVKMLIGPRAACDGIWQGLAQGTPSVCFNQRLYTCTQTTDGPGIRIRLAAVEDAERIAPLAAAMMVEDLGVDPRVPDPDDHLDNVRSRCTNNRTLLAELDGHIVFLLNVGTLCDDGTQVGGTYVVPEFRGRGLSTAGMRSATAALLSMTRCVTLHVNEANTPAVRCYERAGFQRAAPFRLIIH